MKMHHIFKYRPQNQESQSKKHGLYPGDRKNLKAFHKDGFMA